MINQRDWELVPISKTLGKKFGYDIFPAEFKKITGDLSLIRLSDPSFLKAKADDVRRAPIIKKGAMITSKIVGTFMLKSCSVLPVLVSDPRPLDALTTFSQKQSFMLAGRVFSCVDDWLDRIRKDRAIGVLQAVKKFRTPLLQSLNNALKDWEAVTITLINDILVADERLSILSLFDEFIGNIEKQSRQKEHSLEVTVLALMIAKKNNLPIHVLKDLGMAALIHDLGLVVYEQRLQELIQVGGQVLEPDIIKYYYDLHPVYGAVLLSKKNGATIAGVSRNTRSIVLEHEQKINGSGPNVSQNEFSDELSKMNVPKEITYIGENKIRVDSSHTRDIEFPGTDRIKRFMSLASQILHVSELYVTKLDQNRRRKVEDPHKETLKLMVNEAGERINGEVFEVFFNHLIPPDYYPDNLVVTLKAEPGDKGIKYKEFDKCTGVILNVKDSSGVPRKMLQILKQPDGREYPKKVIFDLANEKKYIYLKIDDWSKYGTKK
ncbi:HD domain-containing protein [candidate division KSB1 bacterium]